MEQVLTPRQVAVAIGVSEASLKRWCDKGLVEATRTVGGHRRLPIAGVLRFLQDRGQPLVKPEILGLPSATGTGEHSIERARERFQEALEQGDLERVRRTIFDLFLAKFTACEIGDRVISPTFEQLGEKWRHGELEIFKERRACELCMRALNELRTGIPEPGENAPIAIGGSLEQDVYTLPTTLVELTLREIGFNAQSFGVGLPAETIGEAVKELKPAIVWVSISHVQDMSKVISGARQLHEVATECGASLVIGGRAATYDLRSQLVFSAHCDTLAHMETFAQSKIGLPENVSQAG